MNQNITIALQRLIEKLAPAVREYVENPVNRRLAGQAQLLAIIQFIDEVKPEYPMLAMPLNTLLVELFEEEKETGGRPIDPLELQWLKLEVAVMATVFRKEVSLFSSNAEADEFVAIILRRRGLKLHQKRQITGPTIAGWRKEIRRGRLKPEYDKFLRLEQKLITDLIRRNDLLTRNERIEYLTHRLLTYVALSGRAPVTGKTDCLNQIMLESGESQNCPAF